jgi:hypothetical protein
VFRFLGDIQEDPDDQECHLEAEDERISRETIGRWRTGQSGNEQARVRQVSRRARSRCAENKELFHAEAQRRQERDVQSGMDGGTVG